MTYADEDGNEMTVKLVGVDEANMEHGKINWISPVARALMKKGIGDEIELRTANGTQSIEIINIMYEIER